MNESKLQSIRNAYYQDLPQKILNLRSAWQRADWPVLAQDAHKLANAGMFGLPRVSELARKIEFAAEKTQVGQIAQLLEELDREIKTSIPA